MVVDWEAALAARGVEPKVEGCKAAMGVMVGETEVQKVVVAVEAETVEATVVELQAGVVPREATRVATVARAGKTVVAEMWEATEVPTAVMGVEVMAAEVMVAAAVEEMAVDEMVGVLAVE